MAVQPSWHQPLQLPWKRENPRAASQLQTLGQDAADQHRRIQVVRSPIKETKVSNWHRWSVRPRTCLSVQGVLLGMEGFRDRYASKGDLNQGSKCDGRSLMSLPRHRQARMRLKLGKITEIGRVFFLRWIFRVGVELSSSTILLSSHFIFLKKRLVPAPPSFVDTATSYLRCRFCRCRSQSFHSSLCTFFPEKDLEL